LLLGIKLGEKGKKEKGEKGNRPEDMFVPGFPGDAQGSIALQAS
jgi:hypothetical protein